MKKGMCLRCQTSLEVTEAEQEVSTKVFGTDITHVKVVKVRVYNCPSCNAAFFSIERRNKR